MFGQDFFERNSEKIEQLANDFIKLQKDAQYAIDRTIPNLKVFPENFYQTENTKVYV